MKLEKVLLTTFISLVVFSVLLLKIFGASEIPRVVEKDGFCKLTYGEDYYYSEKIEACKYKKEIRDPIYLSEKEFRDLCPRVNFFEFRLYSNCFYNGENLN